MTVTGTPTEGEAIVFTWLADKVLGGVKKAFNWGWDRGKWAAAQDRCDQRIIKDHSRIRILGQTGSKLLEDIIAYSSLRTLARSASRDVGCWMRMRSFESASNCW